MKKEENLVSIIVPFYNSKNYIRTCLDSIAVQTYPHIECILVDDKSSDDSLNIVNDFIGNYHGSIKFYIIEHLKNRGQSAGRNTGLNACTGEYVFFLDSDDYISENCIELMVKAIQEDDVEMVVGDLIQVGETFDWPDFYIPGIHTTDIIELACSYRIYTMPWNKLIMKDFLINNSLFFQEGLFHEDDLWSFQLACKMHKMKFIPQKTYYYVIHEGSTATNPSFKFHYINNSMVRLEILKFVFANGFSQNETIYKFITSDIYNFINEPIQRNEKKLALSFYNKLRRSPFWTIGYEYRHSSGKINKLRTLHRLFPIRLGFLFLRFVERINNYLKSKRNGSSI